MPVHLSSQNPSCWHPSWLRNACVARKDPESQWLARDDPEANLKPIKPETADHVAGQSWAPLHYSSLPRPPLANKVCHFVSLCVLLDNSFPSVSSVQFSDSVVSDSLQPHEPQHTRPPCPSPTPGVRQTHVHWVGDAIQPSHPLLSSSHPAFNLSQHQGLFQWVSSSHQVAKVLEFQLQHQNFQWTPWTDLL